MAKKSTITSLSPAAVNSPLRLSLEISRTGILKMFLKSKKYSKIIIKLVIFFCLFIFFIAGKEKEYEKQINNKDTRR